MIRHRGFADALARSKSRQRAYDADIYKCADPDLIRHPETAAANALPATNNSNTNIHHAALAQRRVAVLDTAEPAHRAKDSVQFSQRFSGVGARFADLVPAVTDFLSLKTDAAFSSKISTTMAYRIL